MWLRVLVLAFAFTACSSRERGVMSSERSQQAPLTDAGATLNAENVRDAALAPVVDSQPDGTPIVLTMSAGQYRDAWFRFSERKAKLTAEEQRQYTQSMEHCTAIFERHRAALFDKFMPGKKQQSESDVVAMGVTLQLRDGEVTLDSCIELGVVKLQAALSRHRFPADVEGCRVCVFESGRIRPQSRP